uniref:Uncharacterized protein n=1 Tax=Panagrolaimus davidi TaxID=227884 RepID=A0A914PGD2_9BILA
MENNLSLTIIHRKNKMNENDENFSKPEWENFIFKNKWDRKPVFNQIFSKLSKLTNIGKTFHGIPEIVECKEIPKVQAIIDKIDAMGLSSADQYNRIFVDEFYAIMKPKHVFSSKSIKWGEEVSVIARGKETEDDLKHCAFNFDEKCHRCVHVKSLKVLFVDYYEH